jgi:hypothetical protein
VPPAEALMVMVESDVLALAIFLLAVFRMYITGVPYAVETI